MAEQLTITLSDEAIRLLEVLKARGVYGMSVEEVAERFIDRSLVYLVERGVLKIRDPLLRRRSPDARTS